MAVLQFFERPKELMGCEQSDDLLFFVVNEAYQVRLAYKLHAAEIRMASFCTLELASLDGLCFSRDDRAWKTALRKCTPVRAHIMSGYKNR